MGEGCRASKWEGLDLTPRDKSSKGFPGVKAGGMSGSWPVSVASARNCPSVWLYGSQGVINDKAERVDGGPDHKGPPRLY